MEAGRTRRRRRRIRARNYGHRGKHLNMLIVEQPTAGVYPVQLRGTATGAFALGALLVGPTGAAVLGAEEAGPAPAASAITTAHGAVADGTVLHYQVIVAADVAPQIRLDAEATARDALARINAAAAPATGVLGADGAPVPGVAAVLSASAAPDELRAALIAALETSDTDAQQAAVELVGAAPTADAALLLTRIAERVVGPHDPALAAALVQQLRQIADAKSSIES
jgi:hypothetical protein